MFLLYLHLLSNNCSLGDYKGLLKTLKSLTDANLLNGDLC